MSISNINDGELGSSVRAKLNQLINDSNSNTQSGSFSGSFQGDGSQLTGVTAEWDGSHLGDAAITGSLIVSSSSPTFIQLGDGSVFKVSNPSGSIFINGSGSATITGSLNITGSSDFSGPVTVSGSITISGSGGVITSNQTGSFATTSGSNNFSGNVTVTGSLTVSGSDTFTNIGPFSQTGVSTFDGNITLSGSLIVSGSGGVITSGDTGSFVTNSQTGSFITNSQTSSMTVLSSSFATTASFISSTFISSSAAASGFGSGGGGSSIDTGSLGSTTITGSLTVSGSNTFTNIGSFSQTGNSIFTGNITASGDISASGDIIGVTGSLDHVKLGSATFLELYNPDDVPGLTSPIIQIGTPFTDLFTLNTQGDAVFGSSVAANGGNVTLQNSSNSTFLNVKGNITASSNISASGNISGITGSFSHLVGNSPITVGSPVNFLFPITASNVGGSSIDTGSLGSTTITGSLTVSGSNTFTNIGPFNQTGDSTFTGNITASGNISSSGNLTALDLNLFGGDIDLKNAGAQSNIKFYCESANAHYTKLQAAPHSAYSGNPTVTLPAYAFDFSVPNFQANITASGNVSASAFIGDGSQLTNLPASNPFPFTGDAIITGSLIVDASSSTSQSLSVIGSGSTVFDVVGSVGTLFSVDDSLTGTIFSANDISGFPILQAESTGEVYLGKSPQSLYTTAVVSSTSASATHSLAALSTSSYDGAFFEYTAISSSNARAGSVMSVWNGANIVSTETTSSQIGSTLDLTAEVIISQSQAHFVVYGNNPSYKVKTIIKAI